METLTPRKIKNRINKQLKFIEACKNQKPVRKLVISIEWKKSRTWGANPYASAQVYYKDGTAENKSGYTCSGCGYDKESTVIAEIFNDFLLYELYKKHKKESYINGEKCDHPYGVYYYGGKHLKPSENGYIKTPSFNGGVGTSCYYNIAEFIGGTFKHIAWGSTFDVYQFTKRGR